MRRVTGIGGIFFKAKDPEKLYQWYEIHLGIKREHGLVMFPWTQHAEKEPSYTLWTINPASSKYFDPSPAGFMLNYRVEDLTSLLTVLRQEGIAVDRQEEGECGKFAWIMDPEGNRIELWNRRSRDNAV